MAMSIQVALGVVGLMLFFCPGELVDLRVHPDVPGET